MLLIYICIDREDKKERKGPGVMAQAFNPSTRCRQVELYEFKVSQNYTVSFRGREPMSQKKANKQKTKNNKRRKEGKTAAK